MVGAPISYSGYQPAATGGNGQTYAPPSPQMYTTPNATISTLLPYNGLLPSGQAPPPLPSPAAPYLSSTAPAPSPNLMSFPSNLASSAPLNTSYLYPPNPQTYTPNPSSSATPPSPFPPSSTDPANPYPPSFPTYPPNPWQNQPLAFPNSSTYPPTGYPSQPNTYNLQVQAPNGYPPGQYSGTYPPPPSTQYYSQSNPTIQPGVYPATCGVYPPPRY